jgi:hypothetical protein
MLFASDKSTGRIAEQKGRYREKRLSKPEHDEELNKKLLL